VTEGREENAEQNRVKWRGTKGWTKSKDRRNAPNSSFVGETQGSTEVLGKKKKIKKNEEPKAWMVEGKRLGESSSDPSGKRGKEAIIGPRLHKKKSGGRNRWY